jgi:hypothetical protein
VGYTGCHASCGKGKGYFIAQTELQGNGEILSSQEPMYSYEGKLLQNDPEGNLLVACLVYSSYSENGSSTFL